MIAGIVSLIPIACEISNLDFDDRDAAKRS